MPARTDRARLREPRSRRHHEARARNHDPVLRPQHAEGLQTGLTVLRRAVSHGGKGPRKPDFVPDQESGLKVKGGPRCCTFNFVRDTQPPAAKRH